jgi:hypothetical protein
MLFFSETASTLPGIMEVNDAFERDYDQEEYEKKIRQLIRNVRKRARRDDSVGFLALSDATRILRKEDHYLSVMLDDPESFVRPRGDLLKLFGASLAVALIGLFFLYALEHLGIKTSGEFLHFAFWVTGVIIYLLLLVFSGWKRAADAINKLTGKFVALFR